VDSPPAHEVAGRHSHRVPRPGRYDEVGLARLADEQDHVVSRDQLASLGFDRHHVAHRIDIRRPIGNRVVAVTTGALTAGQRRWVAVLHSGPGSALAAATALEAEGLVLGPSPVLRTIVPHGSDPTGLDLPELGLRVVVRQSRLLGPALVHPARTPRRVLLPHAVVDAAAEASTDDRARLTVISAVQQRRWTRSLRRFDLPSRSASSRCAGPTARGTSTPTSSRGTSASRSTAPSISWWAPPVGTTTGATCWALAAGW
jgi:hypothetical protein